VILRTDVILVAAVLSVTEVTVMSVPPRRLTITRTVSDHDDP
jgi:hypothetical protein